MSYEIKDGVIINDTQEITNVSTDSTLTGDSDTTLVTEKAVKGYVDEKGDIITAQINNPTNSEIQELIDSGITDFICDYVTLSGVLVFNEYTEYTFRGGIISVESGCHLMPSNSDTGKLNFNSAVYISSATTPPIFGDFGGNIEVRGTLASYSDVNATLLSTLYCENLGTSTVNGYNINCTTDGSGNNKRINHQYAYGASTTSFNSSDTTLSNQTNWLRNDQTDWDADSGNTALLNKPEVIINGGQWAEGEYQKNIQVRDGLWTMLSNKVTSDRAAPQEIGSPMWSIDEDTPFNTGQYTGIIKATQTYTMKKDVVLKELVAKMPNWTLNDTTTKITVSIGNDVIPISNPILSSDGEWVTIRATSKTVLEGTVVSVDFVMYHSNASQNISGGWTSNIGTGVPVNQTYNISSVSTGGTLVIDHTDLDGDERTSELRGVAVGSIITLSETSDSARSTTVRTTSVDTTSTSVYSTYTYDLVDTGSKGSIRDALTTTVSIDVPIVVNTDYSVFPGGYAVQPALTDVTTALAYDGIDQGAPTDTAYGLNLLVQEINASEDWDTIAYLGEVGASGGVTNGDGVNPTSWENGDVKVSLIPTGDDNGVAITGGELSVGTPGDPREIVVGGGDSYPLSAAYQCDEANTTGLIITGATDVTTIFQSDTGSSTALYGGTTAGKYILVGSDYPYLGVKVKMTDGGDVDPDNVRLEAWIGDGVYNPVSYMATNANYPFKQNGNKIGTDLIEQWRFGFDPEVESLWDPVTLNINGVDITKYWGRMVIEGTGIVAEPIVEQIKCHTNRFEVNASGVTEYFGQARFPKTTQSGLQIATANANIDPINENVLYGALTTAKYVDNEFSTTADDGFLIVQGVESGLDTSMQLWVSLSYYVKGTSTGDLVFDVDVFQVGDGFVYDGTGVPDTYSITDTVAVDSNLVRRTSIIKIDAEKIQPGEALVISVRRNAASNPSDTLDSNVVLTYASITGWFWR